MLLRSFALFAGFLVLTACTNANDLGEEPTYLGDFRMGHNVVVAPNLTKGPASREASEEEWAMVMTKAIGDRFGRYQGERYYHLGVSIEGYVLAVPGVPLVLSPKSALILNVTVWDDAKQEKLNAKPEQITVLESFSGNTLLGSGLTQSKAKQLDNLSRNAAKLIENWLVRENAEKGWFEGEGGPSEAAREAAEAIEEEPSDASAMVEKAKAQAEAEPES
ncbi:hypothetical protein [Roseovarius sp. MMSF_3281]|uniref:hypothetical protein n=1 Tax=Roseovarius sp. MMSF_3281 TaxID=3046694 RepID=UPI00273FA38C|nr:hypothetical protein [Roseovarius sp. MMSF_3281]